MALAPRAVSVPAFTTSFGTTIPVVPGYRRAHLLVDASAVFGKGGGTRPLGFDGFVKDVYQYALMLDFLKTLGLDRRWVAALDVGGAEGVVSRLLRGQGRASHTTTVEIEDFRPALSTRRFVRLWLKLRLATALARRRPALRGCLTAGAPWRGKALSNYTEDFGWTPPADSPFWRVRLPRPPRIDRYELGDFYRLPGPYDLIVAVSAIAWFRIEELFEKVRALLRPGGVFYAQADYWWFPVNSTYVIGEFPYVTQRLTAEDFARYLEEFHPDESADMLRRYSYFHRGAHPTMDDYATAARRAGLEVLGMRGLTPGLHTPGTPPATPRFIVREDVSARDAALVDVRRFRPGVTEADLGTSWVQMALTRA